MAYLWHVQLHSDVTGGASVEIETDLHPNQIDLRSKRLVVPEISGRWIILPWRRITRIDIEQKDAD